MNVQEFAELAAGHALHALSPEDERTFLAALAEHPEWASIVESDVDSVIVLAEGAAEVVPPPGIRDALLAQIAGAGTDAHAESQAEAEVDAHAETPDAGADALQVLIDEPPTTESIQTVQRRRWTRGVFALAASIVLLVALGYGAALVGDLLTPKPAAVVALQQIEQAPDAESVTGETAAGGTVTAHWATSLGKAVVVTDGLPELGPDEVYQAWFVRGESPVSAGTFETDAAGTATALLTGDMQAEDLIALTVEPAGGSEAPTTDPIIAIPTA